MDKNRILFSEILTIVLLDLCFFCNLYNREYDEQNKEEAEPKTGIFPLFSATMKQNQHS